MFFEVGNVENLCAVVYNKNRSSSVSNYGTLKKDIEDADVMSFLLNNIDNKDIDHAALFKGNVHYSSPVIDKTFVGTASKTPLKDDSTLRIIVKGTLDKEWVILYSHTDFIEKLFREDRRIKSVRAYKGLGLIKMMERD